MSCGVLDLIHWLPVLSYLSDLGPAARFPQPQTVVSEHLCEGLSQPPPLPRAVITDTTYQCAHALENVERNAIYSLENIPSQHKYIPLCWISKNSISCIDVKILKVWQSQKPSLSWKCFLSSQCRGSPRSPRSTLVRSQCLSFWCREVSRPVPAEVWPPASRYIYSLPPQLSTSVPLMSLG